MRVGGWRVMRCVAAMSTFEYSSWPRWESTCTNRLPTRVSFQGIAEALMGPLGFVRGPCGAQSGDGVLSAFKRWLLVYIMQSGDVAPSAF